MFLGLLGVFTGPEEQETRAPTLLKVLFLSPGRTRFWLKIIGQLVFICEDLVFFRCWLLSGKTRANALFAMIEEASTIFAHGQSYPMPHRSSLSGLRYDHEWV